MDAAIRGETYGNPPPGAFTMGKTLPAPDQGWPGKKLGCILFYDCDLASFDFASSSWDALGVVGGCLDGATFRDGLFGAVTTNGRLKLIVAGKATAMRSATCS